jgi:hypothetical protein
VSARILRLSPSARTCVFVKQSPGPANCNPTMLNQQVVSHHGAPLLPKLRGYFAEFLNEGSPDRLRVLTPTHQCRFAVRTASSSTTAFLGSTSTIDSPLALTASSHSALSPKAYHLGRGLTIPALDLPRSVPIASSLNTGTGISTCCPSPTTTTSSA